MTVTADLTACLCVRRCDWSDRENTYLLLARVALGLLVDTYKVPSRQYLTVRDALHETIEVRRVEVDRGWQTVP